MPQNHTLVKEPLKVQNKKKTKQKNPLDFNITGDKKIIDVASDFTLWLRFKKLPPVQF